MAEPGFARRSTFSRTLTFSPETYNRAVLQPLEGLQRTFTEIGMRIDPDAQMTNALIETYTKAAEGNEGDLPLQTGFARKAKFWKLLILLVAISCFMGLVASGFMNATENIPKQWQRCDYTEDIKCGEYYEGKLWWIGVTGGGGLLVGLIRFFTKYPRHLPGLFKDVNDFHVEPCWAPITFTISLISLSCGATIGPEQALGNAGGGLATWLTEVLDPAWFSGDDDYKSLLVLGGMTAPLGALFQAPFLGALMIHELGEPPKSFMESTTILAVCAVVCFIVYYELVGESYIEELSNKGAFLSAQWLHADGYQSWMVGTGFVIGIVSAMLSFLCIVTIGITKQIFNRIRMRLEHNKFLQEILPPVIGGICIGLVNWALPGTVGNGNMVNGYFIRYSGFTSNTEVISRKLLICTGFARMFLLGVSMNCGFVGGVVFPFLTMGIITGCIAFQFYPHIPLGLFVASFMVSLPCGIVPMPFTFTCLSAFAFFLGLNQTVPVFVAVITSYSLVCSTGLMKHMVNKSEERARKEKEANENKANGAAEKEVAGTADRDKARKEADDFALAHYLNKEKKGSATDDV
ncbi:chloride channel [Ochromonadaceae sp. CCMP2298]|nr:chloride channel [Ochromonadaceae sp. CCMP2298]